jgi:hypothetical protein
MQNDFKNDIYRIRYNTAATSDLNSWRVIDSKGNEHLVGGVDILVPCITTKDWIEEINAYKYHLTCKGRLVIEENFAFIVSPN